MSAEVKFDIELLVKALEFVSHLVTYAPNVTVLTVVEEAVVEDEKHIVNEFLGRQVVISVQALLYGTKVNWLLHDIVIISGT